HGGVFKEDLGGVLRYVGGKGKTFEVDPDHLCWWFLKELAESCGEYGEIQCIYYLNPNNSLAHGFTKVYDDEEVRRMGEVASKFRSVELYVSHGSGAELGAQISPTEVHSQRPKKLTPKRAPQLLTRKSPNKKESFIESNTKDLTPTEPASTEVPLFTLNQKNQAGLDSENQINVITPTTSEYDKFVSLIQTRINTLSGDNLQVNHESQVTTTIVPEGYEWEDNRPDSPIPWQDLLGPYSSSEGSDSDFEPADAESDDDLSINDEVEEEELFEVGESEGGVKVSETTEKVQRDAEEGRVAGEDNSQLVQTGPSTEEGHLSDCYDSDEDINTPSDSDEDDTGFKISDKGRQQRLGVDCAGGCLFRLYASWDTRRATFVLKTVKGEHTCVRNMERNKQLRTGWIAKQLLEVFKSRPHWPAKDIIECIRLRYRMMVKKAFAYKVKYRAHRLLHGSMKDHYNKVGQYLQAIKDSSPGTDIKLITFEKPSHSSLIFQRLYVCFDGVKKGWIEGRDVNDQMYSIAWAVVEGENNLSWNWFLTELQASLSLAEDEGLVVISDEHQAILNGVKSVFPKAEHRHYARHIFALWHKTYRGDEMKYISWKIAKSYNMADYTEALAELREACEEAANAFVRNVEEWVDTCYHKSVYMKAYGGAIPSIEGERHWKGHNKRKFPNNAITEEPQAQPKRLRGRPQKNASSHPQTVPDISSQVHHDTTAEPTRLGRGGRVIRGGRGRNSGRGGSSASTAGASSGGVTNSRGGSSGAPRGRGGSSGAPRGRGGRGKSVQPSPQGQGVLFAADGSVMINAPGTSGGPRFMETQMSDFTKG
ncbi:Protocadherin-1, partial [Bienertia sinuspersici]